MCDAAHHQGVLLSKDDTLTAVSRQFSTLVATFESFVNKSAAKIKDKINKTPSLNSSDKSRAVEKIKAAVRIEMALIKRNAGPTEINGITNEIMARAKRQQSAAAASIASANSNHQHHHQHLCDGGEQMLVRMFSTALSGEMNMRGQVIEDHPALEEQFKLKTPAVNTNLSGIEWNIDVDTLKKGAQQTEAIAHFAKSFWDVNEPALNTAKKSFTDTIMATDIYVKLVQGHYARHGLAAESFAIYLFRKEVTQFEQSDLFNVATHRQQLLDCLESIPPAENVAPWTGASVCIEKAADKISGYSSMGHDMNEAISYLVFEAFTFELE